VKKSIWPKSKLMQNVCRRPSDRLLGILARLFLEPKFLHTNFLISSHLPDRYYPHWDYFSAFVLFHDAKDVSAKLSELEAILIAAIPRSVNHSTPKFKPINIPKSLRLDD
jgi:hypothetical protein